MLKSLGNTQFINDANLLGYWKLDNNAIDYKWNRDLTIVWSPTYVAWVFSDWLDTWTSNSTKRAYNTTNLGINGWICSISAWIKVNWNHTTSDHPLAVNEYSWNNGGAYVLNWIWFNQTNTAVVFSRLKTQVAWQDASYTFNPWTWRNHYVYTYDGTNIRWYVNGNLVVTAAASWNGNNEVRNTWINILWSDYTSWHWFSWWVDDVAIFNKVLTDLEVLSIYDSNQYWEYLADLDKSNEVLNTDLYSDPNLVAYYRLEWNSNDSKWTRNWTDTTMTYWTSYGKYWQWWLFNGSTSKISLSVFSITSNFTIAARFKTTATWAWKMIFADYQQTSWISWIQFGVKDNNKLSINKYNNWTLSNVIWATTVTDWNRHHWCVVWNWTNLILYLDWNSDWSTATSTAPTYTANNRCNIWVNEYTPWVYTDRFNWSIDDVIIFNRALSQAEVNKIVQTGKTKAYYRLNWNSKDYSSNWNHWTDSNITYTEAAWRYWKWAVFNGSNAAISLPLSLMNWTSANITMSCWVKRLWNANTIAWQIFDIRNATNSMIIWTDNSPVNYYLVAHFWSPATYSVVTDRTNQWKLFTIAVWWWIAKFYVDWQLKSTQTCGSTPWTATWWIKLWWERNGAANRFFNWHIDEAILDYKTWTDKEISDYYSYTKWVFIPNLI